MAHTYEVIGTPEVQKEYCDEWQTTMVFRLRRDDGKEDTIWVTAGVPDWQRGSSQAAGHRMGFESVNVFGGSIDEWCGRELYADITDDEGDFHSLRMRDEIMAMLEAVSETALANQVSPARYEDDSEVIDIIEAAKAEWFEAHPECSIETSEDTDAAINKALGLPNSGSLRGLAVDLADSTPAEISERVKSGLDNWFREASKTTLRETARQNVIDSMREAAAFSHRRNFHRLHVRRDGTVTWFDSISKSDDIIDDRADGFAPIPSVGVWGTDGYACNCDFCSDAGYEGDIDAAIADAVGAGLDDSIEEEALRAFDEIPAGYFDDEA
jgi:hypothetical protein